jgi:hypothetical protein
MYSIGPYQPEGTFDLLELFQSTLSDDQEYNIQLAMIGLVNGAGVFLLITGWKRLRPTQKPVYQ